VILVGLLSLFQSLRKFIDCLHSSLSGFKLKIIYFSFSVNQILIIILHIIMLILSFVMCHKGKNIVYDLEWLEMNWLTCQVVNYRLNCWWRCTYKRYESQVSKCRIRCFSIRIAYLEMFTIDIFRADIMKLLQH
jgi:ABC-type uncharacterized transport system fused permease/ATPase subunit